MRRCETLQSCGIREPRRFAFLDIPVADVLTKPSREWPQIVASFRGRNRIAKHVINVDWGRFKPQQYMFSHCSIVASVATDSTNHRIVKPCEELVNINGNAWTNEVLPHCFRTFIGAENYYEHIQVPELSKGKILDAALRPVTFVGENGGKADVYYCDILVATERKHEDIVGRVASGELSALSMGALANQCQCSFCGKVTDDFHPNCIHLDNSLRQSLVANDGKKYLVAELCGSLDEFGKYVEDSCVFIEASWVESPAFSGAVMNHIIDCPGNEVRQAEIHDLAEISFFSNPSIMSQIRVADIRHMAAVKLALREMRRSTYAEIANSIAKEVVRGV